MIKAVIFDKDGVLLDLEATWLNSAIAMTHFIAGLTDGSHAAEEFQKIIGIDEKTRQIDADGLFASGSMATQFAAFAEAAPKLANQLHHDPQIREKLRDVFLEARDETLAGVGSVANGDVITPLGELHDSGYKMAVLTNDSEESANRGCQDIGVSRYLEMVVGFDSGFGSKPEPEGFLAICQALSCHPGEVAMVGDTFADRHAAERAGAGAFIGISSIYPNAPKALEGIPHLLPDLTSLPTIIRALG